MKAARASQPIREVIEYCHARCSLGAVWVAGTEKGVRAIWLGDDLGGLRERFPAARLEAAGAAFQKLAEQVIAEIEKPGARSRLPLDVRGTSFQRQVWQLLKSIPPGSTASYTEVAARLGRPKSVRAVAGACAANLHAVLIPCHRVVRADGSLSGYRWGVALKRALLAREKAA